MRGPGAAGALSHVQPRSKAQAAARHHADEYDAAAGDGSLSYGSPPAVHTEGVGGGGGGGEGGGQIGGRMMTF